MLALRRLLPSLLERTDVPRTVFHSRFMKAAGRMEHNGVPIDTAALATIREHWSAIQLGLIERVDATYRVFQGRSFRQQRFGAYLASAGIAWPRTEGGDFARDADTFHQMAKVYPQVAPLAQLLHALGQLRLFDDLAVGADGRNRCLLSAFRARTSRSQPSNARFIFGPAVFLRSLIRPEPDHGLAYIDYSSQEIAIAGALSGDAALMTAYTSGDCYLQFGKQAGLIPADGTRATHEIERELCKQCMLGVQYLMSEFTLAERMGASVAHARELLRIHRATYPKFWTWSEAALNHALLLGRLPTVFGWTVHVGKDANRRSLQNFPMQANGAEMLRLACCLATERGIKVCAPIHDAMLIEAPLGELNDAVAEAQAAMAEASEIVLNGFRLRTEAKLVRYPDRYTDKRGVAMWGAVWSEIAQLEAAREVARA